MATKPLLNTATSAGTFVMWSRGNIRPFENHPLIPPTPFGERSGLGSSVEAIAQLGRAGRLVRYPAQTSVFHHGNPVDSVFVVRQGRLKLSLNSHRGRCVVFRFAVSPDLLGLSSVLNRTDHEFRAHTLEPSVLLTIQRNDFLQLFQTSCEVNSFATQALARDHEAMLRGLRRLELLASVRERLAQLLLDCLEFSRRDSLPMSIRMNWTFAELAEMVNSTRETVNRTMRQLEREELISLRGSLVMILDHARLKLLAG